MNETTFERRAELWLEAGPTELPVDAIDLVMAAIDRVPQERPPFRLFRRSIAASNVRLAVAAVVLLVAAGGATWLRSSLLDVAQPRNPSDLLYGFPETTTLLERSGKATSELVQVDVGGLPAGGAFVLVGSCTGGTGILAQVYYPAAVQAVPTVVGGVPQRSVMKTLGVTCDGIIRHLNIGTLDMPAGATSVVGLTIDAGVTWRFAIGEYRGLAAAPSFPAVAPAAGWYVVMDTVPMLVTSETSFGVEPSTRARSIALLVQCSGDPVAVSADSGGAPATVACDDPARVTRLEYPAIQPALNFRVSTDGMTWLRLTAEADGEITSALPTAPALPPGLEDVRFADASGQYLAFGRLGSNQQTIVRAPGAQAGIAGGDLVSVAIPSDGGGTLLDLWSISQAAQLRTLARIPGGDNVGRSWVDASHDQVFYVVFKSDFTTEWHRVGLDGAGDRVIATAPDGSVVADGTLPIDDSGFVVDWCPPEGQCTRVVYDSETGATRQLEIDGERTCAINGVVADRIVALSGRTCAEGDGVHVTVQDLDGGPRRVLVDGPASGVVVRASDGDRFAYSESGDERTTYFAVALDGGTPRRLATFDHPNLSQLLPATISLPVGDWVLLGGPLGDTPSNHLVGLVVPRLLNVLTGEVIELVNLPHSKP